MVEIAVVEVLRVDARIQHCEGIPVGIIGGAVRLVYSDPVWDGLTKNVLFRGSGKTVIEVNVGELVRIPGEVVAQKGSTVMIGIYGTNAQKDLAIPTIWATLGTVMPAAEPYADLSADPELPVWAQLQGRIEELEQNGTPGSGGNVDLTGYATEQYVRSYAQPKGNYLTEHQDISGKLDASALPTAINTALAQAKASGEFDGADGQDGRDGQDGQDGYTPVRGTDYWTAADQTAIVNATLAALPTWTGGSY